MALFPASSMGGVQDIVAEAFTTTVASIASQDSIAVNFTGIAKTGYTPLIAIYCKNNKTRAIVPSFTTAPVVNGETQLAMANIGTSTITSITVTCYVIFIKK